MSKQQVSEKAKKKGKQAIAKKNNVLEKLKIEYVAIDAVKPNDYNPNRQSDHDFQLLLKSMEEDGFTQPVVVLDDLTIVDGEHRWRAANQLGYTEIPVVKTNMSPEQMRISTIRHNKARGSHDVELEAELLRDLEKLGARDWAQDSLMMDDEEMNRLIDDMKVTDGLAGDEFNEGWTPKQTHDGEDAISSTEKQSYSNENTTVDQAMSSTALEKKREAEKKLATAKTEEERKMALAAKRIYRINLIFNDEEADIIKEALGDKPADELMAICKAKLGKK